MSDTQRPRRALRTTQRAAAQRSRAALLSWEPKNNARQSCDASVCTCTQPQPAKARAHTGASGATSSRGMRRAGGTQGKTIATDMTTARCTPTLHKPKLTWPLLLAAHCKPATATQPPERSRPVAVGPRTARPSHFEQPQITAADLPAPSAGPLTPAECFCYGLAPCMPAPPSLWHVSRRGVE